MTDEQAKQYEICKTRRHEEPEHQMQANYVSQPHWKTCRWCGTQYQEVQETRQVERA